jgi:hypothetical protein
MSKQCFGKYDECSEECAKCDSSDMCFVFDLIMHPFKNKRSETSASGALDRCFGKYDPFSEVCLHKCNQMDKCFEAQSPEDAQSYTGKCTCPDREHGQFPPGWAAQIDGNCPIHGF